MSLFAIGDLHLSLRTNKQMDIFKGWEDYVSRLEKKWRAVVSDEDTVVVVGDISWEMDIKDTLTDFKFIDSLPGKKLFIKGNHDYWWNTKKKMEIFLDENELTSIKILHNNAYRVGDFTVCGTRGWFFDDKSENEEKVIAREVGRLKASLDEAKILGGEPIVFLHYPPISQNGRCDEIYNVLIEYKVKRCYYAHLHGEASNWAFTGESDGIKFSLVSSDFLDFCPKLIELIK